MTELSIHLLSLMGDELNVKKILFGDTPGVVLDTALTPELLEEGMMREIVRHIQDLRKKAGLLPQEKAQLLIATNEKGKAFIEKFKSELLVSATLDSVSFEKVSGGEIVVQELRFMFAVQAHGASRI